MTKILWIILMIKLILTTLFSLLISIKKEEVKEDFSYNLKNMFKVKKNSEQLVEACSIFSHFLKTKYNGKSSKKNIALYDRLSDLFTDLDEKERFIYYLYISQQKNASNLIIAFHDENFIVEMEKKKDVLYGLTTESEINDVLSQEEMDLLNEIEAEQSNKNLEISQDLTQASISK
jgi:pyruvate kinase